MKNIVTKILIALLAFLFGIGTFLCWNILSANKFQSKMAELSVLEPSPELNVPCRLVDEPGGFDEKYGKFVSFKATAYVIHDGTVILIISNVLDCFKPDLMMPAKLERNSYAEIYLKNFLENKNVIPRNEHKEVDIKVTGTAKILYGPDGYKWFSINPVNVEIISAVRKFEPKGAA